ncbi:hypothetical protein [Pseudophaeobacter sp.]|uniref:hypothetical protein n=1 Tax=Pseudophaeobacter sp. TaxID=1971739 RepID=UPI004057E2B2
MELFELLEDMRSRYIAVYEAAYLEQLNTYEQVTPEVGFEISGDVFEGLFVADFVGVTGGETSAIEVGESSGALGGQFSGEYRGVNYSLDTISWDAMLFEVTPQPEELVGVDAWFNKWMLIEKQAFVEGQNYSGTIHSMRIDGNQVGVDFGSAPVEAIQGLFDVFAESGVSSVTVVTARD